MPSSFRKSCLALPASKAPRMALVVVVAPSYPRVGFEGPGSIRGRAVIVHADADDFKTQPAGNAGRRLACGVIGVTAAE